MEIKLQKRELLGKKAKRLLKNDVVPAVIYSSKGDSIIVQGQYGELIKLLAAATTTTLVDLDIDGEKMKAVIKNVDTDPITDHIRHVSFFAVDPKTEMIFAIPYKLIGNSLAVKNNLGVLVQVSQSLDVRTTVANLIPEIVVDISGLDTAGMTILVSDLVLPEGIHLIREEDKHIAVVTVTKIQKMAEVEETAAVDPAAPAAAVTPAA